MSIKPLETVKRRQLESNKTRNGLSLLSGFPSAEKNHGAEVFPQHAE